MFKARSGQRRARKNVNITETLGIIAIVLAVIVGISASILAYKTRKPPAK